MTTEAQLATKPEDIGIDSERLEAVFARAKRDVDDGVLTAAQVAVARHGQLAGMRTFGTITTGDAEAPATNETLFAIFSSTKAVVGAATWLLLEEGLLRLDERVGDVVPEFASNGKDQVTVEQAMLHIGGFPRAPLGPGQWETREGRLQAFARWKLNWEPGSQFEYHATSLHWVLAEIIERRTGIEFKQFVRERIIEPMGLPDLYVGLPDALNSRVADVHYVGEPEPPPGGWGEVTPEAILRFNDAGVRAVGVPGGGGIANAASLALFYQPLVTGGVTADGTRIMKAETIEFATKVRTKEFHRDLIMAQPVNRALTVVVAGDDGQKHIRGFGHTASARAFGHGGAGGQIAWGDPETGISLGYCTDSFVDALTQGRRITAIGSLAANCAV